SAAHTTPAAIRRALRYYSTALVNGTDLTSRIVDLGDSPDPDSEVGRRAAQDMVARAAGQADLIIALGGDNSLTVPVAKGVWGERLGTTAGLIPLDAHLDMREGWSNGSPVRELLQSGLKGRQAAQLRI